MFKIINYSLIFLFLFTNTIAQSQQTKTDSTQVKSSSEKNEYKLFLNPFFNSKKMFLGQDDYEIYKDEFLNQTQIPDNDIKPGSLAQLKLKMNNYLQQRRNILPNYDLGEFGKYLGYANIFAAVLLAITHITKYGFK